MTHHCLFCRGAAPCRAALCTPRDVARVSVRHVRTPRDAGEWLTSHVWVCWDHAGAHLCAPAARAARHRMLYGGAPPRRGAAGEFVASP